MKKSYFDSIPKPKDVRKSAYQSHSPKVKQLFEAVKENHTYQLCKQLENTLKLQAACKELSKDDKLPIFQYFLNHQLKTLSCLKDKNSINLSIIMLTKCKLQGFKLDWKEAWENILKQCPQIPYYKESNLIGFFKQLRPFFDQNNALDVYDYFSQNHPDSKTSFSYTFINITPKTKNEIFIAYINALLEDTKLNKLKKADFIYCFLSSIKNRKEIIMTQQQTNEINNLLLELLIVPKYPKDQIQSRFNKQNATIFYYMIGKANKESVKLIDTVFMFLKKFIKPLENSSYPTRFLNNILAWIWKRNCHQKRARQRLEKLLQKMKKKGEEKDPQKDEDDEQQQKQEEEMGDDIQEEIDDFQLENEVNLEESEEIRPNSDEEKKEKLEVTLANQITPQILCCFQQNISEIFQAIYFVNSKSTIPQLLKNIYKIFPSFSIKSLDLLDKAEFIPNISEEGLIQNMTVSAQCLLAPGFEKEGVENITRILRRTLNCRKIADVWAIYTSFFEKIPLLDQGDLKKIGDDEKDLFEQKFNLNHDQFYEDYSENVFEAYKRFLAQGEFYQESFHQKYIRSLEDLYYNSYPCMKERIVAQTMDTIINTPHRGAFNLFLTAGLSKKNEQVIRSQLKSLNPENRDADKLRLWLIQILSQNLSLQQFMQYAKQMTKHGHFNIILKYLDFKCSEFIEWKQLPSSLVYFSQKIQINLILQNKEEQVKKILIQVKQLAQMIIKQIEEKIAKLPFEQNKNISVIDQIINFYNHSEKLATFQERKEIYQLLSILEKLNTSLEGTMMVIDKNILELKDSGVSPFRFGESITKQILQRFVFTFQLLSDPKVIGQIVKLINNQRSLYTEIIEKQKKKMSRMDRQDKVLQMPNMTNRIRYGIKYISQARIWMSSQLQSKKEHIIKDIKEEVFILCLVQDTDNTKSLVSLLISEGEEQFLRKKVVQLFQRKVQNRHLMSKLQLMLQYISCNQLKLTEEEVEKIFVSLTFLITSNKTKVKQIATKCMKKMINILTYLNFTEQMDKKMMKYLKIEKMEMVWIIWVMATIIPMNEAYAQKQQKTNQIISLMSTLQPLILHDIRSTRRMALLSYSLLSRKIKKINESKVFVNFDSKEYEEKTADQFFRTGFIRKQFYHEYLKDQNIHRVYPRDGYEVKKKYNLPSSLYQFLLKSPENSMKFIKNFHLDMASTPELLMSAMQSAMFQEDLSTVATKAVERNYFSIKTKSMSISRIQIMFGERFFRYLCGEDAKSQFIFFKTVQEYVKKVALNMESLDNQTLVIIYSYCLLKEYEKNFTKRIPEVEIFLSQILSDLIDKSSGKIFKKLLAILFKKIKNKNAIKFIEQLANDLIEKRKKVSRAGQILLAIHKKDMRLAIKLCKMLLDDEIQLESAFFQSLVPKILSLSQRSFSVSLIEKTKIINIEKNLAQNTILKYQDHIMENIEEFFKYFLEKISSFTQKSVQMCKSGFNIITKTLLSCTELLPTEGNLDFSLCLIRIGIDIINSENELQLDCEGFYKNIGVLVGSAKLPEKVFSKSFQKFLAMVKPSKRNCELIEQLVRYPVNIMSLPKEILQKFIRVILWFESNSLLYKTNLKILSNLFSYCEKPLELIESIQVQGNNKKMLLYQAFCLASNTKINVEIGNQVLRKSVKERKNLWAKEFFALKGKRQYFDSEENQEFWRDIKQLSNPYHYHA